MEEDKFMDFENVDNLEYAKESKDLDNLYDNTDMSDAEYKKKRNELQKKYFNISEDD